MKFSNEANRIVNEDALLKKKSELLNQLSKAPTQQKSRLNSGHCARLAQLLKIEKALAKLKKYYTN